MQREIERKFRERDEERIEISGRMNASQFITLDVQYIYYKRNSNYLIREH